MPTTKRFIHSFIFLILLIVTLISLYNAEPVVIPGWYTIDYASKYSIGISIIILSLTTAIGGYAFLSFKKKYLSSWVFGLHFLLTIPVIIALIYPFKSMELTSVSVYEIEKLLSQQEWMENILFAIFIVGQLIFLTFFVKSVRSQLRNV